MVVLDTCSLIALCKANVDISAKALGLIAKGSIVPSICFAELACKVKLGKLEMPLSARDLHAHFSQVDNLSIVDIGTEEWLDSIELDWPDNKDPADRIIVAYAIKQKLTIISSDAKMKAFYQKVIW